MLLRVKPLCWLWGLIPLSLIGFLAILGERHNIEAELTQRSLAALHKKGYDWAIPKFNGVDGIISGQAVNAELRQLAVQTVANVRGVRSVQDRLSLLPLIKPYLWSAKRRGQSLDLSGYASSITDRKTIFGFAKAKFPDLKINDETKVALGEPVSAVWLGRINYALNQLARLNGGSVSIEDNQFSIVGQASDRIGYNEMTAALSGGEVLPLNMRVARFNIMAPVVDPYLWSASYNSGRVVLEGFVESEAQRTNLLALVKQQFSGAEIIDHMQLGTNPPKAWSNALKLSLAQLARLQSGSVQHSHQAVKLVGVARSPEQAKSIREIVRAKYPIGYKVDDVITVESNASQLPVQSPYMTSVRLLAENKMVLAGYVPGDDGKKLLFQAIRQKYPAIEMDDQLRMASGAPSLYFNAMNFGLGALHQLGGGEFILRDQNLVVSGETRDKDVHQQLSELLSQQSPNGYETINKIKLIGEAKPQTVTSPSTPAAEPQKLVLAEKTIKPFQGDVFEGNPSEDNSDKKLEKTPPPESPKPGSDEVTALAPQKEWMSDKEVSKKLKEIRETDAFVNALDCEKLMNSITRGNAIRFESAKSDIKPESFEVLANISIVAQRCRSHRIRVEGHTDSDGSEAFNMKLSLKRAQAVVDYLNGFGVPIRRISAKGFGENRPVASNESEKGKALNRRIEFTVLDN